MKNIRSILLMAGVVFSLMAPFYQAMAAQNGRVMVDDAEIHIKPSEGSEVATYVNRGQVLRMSSRPKGGWFHVLIPNAAEVGRRFGWIRADDVATGASARARRTEIERAGVQKSQTRERVSRQKKKWVLSPIFDAAFMSPTQYQTTVSDTTGSSILGTAIGGEIGLHVAPDWVVGVRLASHSFARDIIYTDGTGTYKANGFSVGGFVEYYVVNDHPWKIGISGGAGMSLSTVAQWDVATTTQNDSFISLGESVFEGIGRLNLYYNVSSVVDLRAGLGYRILTLSNAILTGTTGSRSTTVDMSGLMVGGGLSIHF